jgi:hypothetical protein
MVRSTKVRVALHKANTKLSPSASPTSSAQARNRADHRHHALDALVVALAHPGYTQRLSRWFQLKDDPARPPLPELPPPFKDDRTALGAGGGGRALA